MKKMLSNIITTIWFWWIMLGTLILGVFMILGILFSDILVMLKSGFSTSTVGFAVLAVLGIVYAVTGWVPVFRNVYYKYPWLYSFTIIMMMHLAILSIAEEILSIGFSVISTPRHIATIIIMVIQVIVCRLIMCVYLKKYPVVLHKYDGLGE